MPENSQIQSHRAILHRTRGTNHGAITRLMSPGDLGRLVKPFVFLDLFDNSEVPLPHFGWHPHSGIATLTYIVEGEWSFEDGTGGQGQIKAGGAEWLRAGGGVWHMGKPVAKKPTRGFQLWLALPPQLELARPESRYQSPGEIAVSGRARVLLGSYGDVDSQIVPPSPINYLAVSLEAGTEWTYLPPEGHTVLWTALARGGVRTPELLSGGELAIYAPGSSTVRFQADTDCEFVLGSAQPHPHDLVLGYYSVHTNPAALALGEAGIEALRDGAGARRQQAA